LRNRRHIEAIGARIGLQETGRDRTARLAGGDQIRRTRGLRVGEVELGGGLEPEWTRTEVDPNRFDDAGATCRAIGSTAVSARAAVNEEAASRAAPS
jgi:hypothetical protein